MGNQFCSNLFGGMCCNSAKDIYADVEITHFELIGHEKRNQNLIKVKLDVFFQLNQTRIGKDDFLYLSPYEDLEKDPVLLIDDAFK